MKAYLFSFKGWHQDPPRYILAHADTEEEAREAVRRQCYYNNYEPARIEDIKPCTIFA